MDWGNSSRRMIAWLMVFFLVVVGAKLWTIQLFGTAIPYWDQWDEARLFFKPWLQGHLTWQDFFRAHNEHRIFFTRVLDLLELKLNGQWDPLLQMVVNALIHASYGCALAFTLWHFTGRRQAGLICFLLLPFFALPFAAENTVHGFQSQMYFLSIFSLAAMVGLGFGKPGGGFWFAGLAAAVMAIFTMGSGFLATIAVVGLIGLRTCRERTISRGQMVTLLAALAVVALGWAMKVSVADNEKFQAQSLPEFLEALQRNLAAPLINRPAVALLFCLPLVVTLVRYFHRDFKNRRAAEFVLMFGLWGLLQAVALAYGRATLVDSNRYQDTLATLPLASLASLFVLAENVELRRRPRLVVASFTIIWVGILMLGLAKVSSSSVTSYLHWCRMWGVVETENLRAFVATADPAWLKSTTPLSVPYWKAPWPADLLHQPELLSIMPPDARPALRLAPDETSAQQFVRDGYAPDQPKKEFTEVWGDYATISPPSPRRFVSQPMATTLPKLILELAAGDDTNDLTVQLVDASGHVTNLPLEKTGRWQTRIVEAPREPFRLKIENQNPHAWIAVGDIKEYGRYSPVVQCLIDHAVAVLAVGLCGWIGLAGFSVFRSGIKFSAESYGHLFILWVALFLLAGVWSRRNFNSADYSRSLHKKWAAEFVAEGRPGRARVHLHEALWLQPDDAEARQALTILKAQGATEAVP